MPLKLGILGSTRGTDMQAIIDAIDRKELDAMIEIVVSNKPDAYILERAKRHGIPTYQSRNESDILRALQEKKIDLILLIGYMRLLSPLFVNTWRNKIMNVHPSLLPAFAGGMDMNVHQAVLDARVKESGCTIHFVDEGADTGAILIQKKCAVDPYDTAETLKAKVQELEGAAFIEAIKWFQTNCMSNQI